MFDYEAVNPGVNAVSYFAYAAATLSILANFSLIAMYTPFCLWPGNPVLGYLGIPVWFVLLGRYIGSAMG